jgi:hypothetical protein
MVEYIYFTNDLEFPLTPSITCTNDTSIKAIISNSKKIECEVYAPEISLFEKKNNKILKFE